MQDTFIPFKVLVSIVVWYRLSSASADSCKAAYAPLDRWTMTNAARGMQYQDCRTSCDTLAKSRIPIAFTFAQLASPAFRKTRS